MKIKFYFLQAFFLIRIPELRAAIGINLNLDKQQVPLLLPVVEAISKMSYNHKPTYLSKVETILDTLTEDVSQFYCFLHL
jgi:hypothetical protein